MNRVVRLALAVAILASPAAHAGEALDALRARGTLRVGTTGDYKPFTFRQPDGTYAGADIAMARRLAARIGVTLEIVPTTWTTLLDDFTARKFDVAMGGVSVNAARAARGTFSAVTFTDGKRPVVRCADKERFTSVDAIDQPGIRVIVNPGGTNEEFARARIHRAELTTHRDNATVFDEILAGRADVMVTDGIEVDHQALLHPELCPAMVPAPFTRLEKAYLVQRDPELAALIGAWLESEMTSGDYARILDTAQHAP